MIIKLKNLDININKSGQGKDVILLHGWGQNIQMMEPIQKNLENNFCVHNFDLPGFGLSQEPDRVYGIEDYVELIREYVVLNQIAAPIFIGHSFGCRIALLYASKYPVHKMVLTGAAGIKPKRKLDYYCKVYSYKILKRLLKLPVVNKYVANLREKSGSSDYQNATEIMKGVLVKAVNTDLTPILTKIECPTLLIFGENDTATPVWMGKIMEEKISDSGLIIFENATHFAYFEQINRFNLIVNNFLEKDKGE